MTPIAAAPKESPKEIPADLPASVAAMLGQISIVDDYPVTVQRDAWLPFLAAVQDRNPVFWDPATARELVGFEIAPTVMLPVWGSPYDWSPDCAPKFSRPLKLHFDVKQAFGYVHGVVAEIDLVMHEPLRPGDAVRVEQILRDVGEEKETALGPGRKWTIEVRFTRQDGALAGIQTLRFFAYGRAVDPDGGGAS